MCDKQLTVAILLGKDRTMSDDDMIRRGDALAAVKDFARDFDRPWREQLSDAIAALIKAEPQP